MPAISAYVCPETCKPISDAVAIGVFLLLVFSMRRQINISFSVHVHEALFSFSPLNPEGLLMKMNRL